MEEPLTGGQSEGTVITQEKIEKMLREYYEMRGWDEYGVPTSAVV